MRSSHFLVCLLLWYCLLWVAACSPVVIKIGGLASRPAAFNNAVLAAVDFMTGKSSGIGFPTAEDLMKNETSSHFFPEYLEVKFEVTFVSTALGGSGNAGLSRLYATELFQNGSVAIIGDSFSNGAIAASEVANVFKRPVISYAATSIALSDKTAHPYFLRTISSDKNQARLITDFCVYYEYFDIVTLGTTDSYGSLAVEELKTNSLEKGIAISASVTLQAADAPSADQAVSEIKSTGVKTIVAFLGSTTAVEQTILAADRLGLMREPYKWIFGDSAGNLYSIRDDGTVTLGSVTVLNTLGYLPSGILFVRSAGGQWSKQKQFQQFMSSSPARSSFDMFAYDAMIAVGKAVSSLLQRSESIDDGKRLTEEIAKTHFLGASGRVRFDEKYDRTGLMLALSNVYNGRIVNIAQWSVEEGIVIASNNFTGPGGASYATSAKDTSYTSGRNQWTPRLVSPRKRYGHTGAADEHSDKLVIFGGNDIFDIFGDCWIYNFVDQIWKQVFPMSVSYPTARFLAASTYVDDRFYLFGGYNGKIYLSDFWYLDTNTAVWTEVKSGPTDIVPSPRAASRMVRYGDDIYIFGGLTVEGCTNQLWKFIPSLGQFEGATQLGSDFPKPRSNFCFLTYKKYFVLFGGKGCSGDDIRGMNDLWIFDLETLLWIEIQQRNAPTPRFDTACAINDNKLFVLLGWDDFSKSNTNDFSFVDITNIGTNLSVTWTNQYSEIPLHTKRDSTEAFTFDQFVIWFGGWGEKVYNDFWSYNTATSNFLRLLPSTESVSGVQNACYARLTNKIYAFGGVSAEGTTTGTFYVYDVTSNTWSIAASSSGIVPSPRSGCVLVSSGTNLYLHGGIADTGSYMADMWRYSTSIGAWDLLEIKTNIPAGRAYHAAAVTASESDMVIYGGFDGKDELVDLWSFSFDFLSWTRHDAEGEVSPSGTIAGQMSFIDTSKVTFYGAYDVSGSPITDCYAFDFDEGKWSVFASPPEGFSDRATPALILLDSSLVLFGGSYYDAIYNDMVQISPSGFSSVIPSSTVYNPPSRTNAKGFFIGNKFLLLHGMGSIPLIPIKSRDVLLPDVWEFKFYPVCSNTTGATKDAFGVVSCVSCSSGYYENRGRCLTCPAGTYSLRGATKCTPCFPGFFNSFEGATSDKFCLPCPQGTYNDKHGAGECLPCKTSNYCPIGSVRPMDFERGTVLSTEISQPANFDSGFTGRNTSLTIAAYTVAAGIGIIIVTILFLIALKVKKFSTFLSRLDFFFSMKHNFEPGAVFSKKTRMGGIFSMITFLFMLAIILNVVIPFVDDNTVERRSLIPNLAVPPQTEVTADFSWAVTAIGHIISCEEDGIASKLPTACAEQISVALESMESKKGTATALPTCQTIQQEDSDDLACKIQFKCTECKLTTALARAVVVANDESFAKRYIYEFNVTAAVPKGVSRVKGGIKSQTSKIFRGRAKPTKILFSGIQTLFNDTTSSKTGYHLNYKNVELGDQVSIYEFSQRTGFAVAFEMEKETTSLEIVWAQKKSITTLITELLGSLVGIISAIGSLMYYTEYALEIIIINKLVPYINKKRGKIPQESATEASETTQKPDDRAPHDVHENDEANHELADTKGLGSLPHQKHDSPKPVLHQKTAEDNVAKTKLKDGFFV